MQLRNLRGLARCAPLALGLLLALALAPGARAGELLRLAMVGGIQLSGVGERLRTRLEAATGVRLELVAVANKEAIVPRFVRGEAELLLIHGGSETFALQAAGLGGRMQVWGFNEHVLVGPAEDPAGVRGAADGAEAFRRIAAARAPFVAFRDAGSHEIVQRLWRQAGIRPAADWVLPDEGERPQEILAQAARQRAYVVVGGIPAAFGKLHGEGLEILLRGDRRMRRAYVALEPGPAHPASAAAREGARRVVDYLVSPAGQADLAAADGEAGGPWIYGLAGAPPALSAGRAAASPASPRH